MLTKRSVLFAALTMGFVGQAGAASVGLTLPSTNNGELFLTAWDEVAQKSYNRQFEVNLESFLPNSLGGDKTPDSGLTLSFAGDALFSSTFAGSDPNNIRWNIATADNTVVPGQTQTSPGAVRLLTTSTSSSGFALSNIGVASAANNANSYMEAVNKMGADFGQPGPCGSGTGTSCATSDPADFGWGGNTSTWGESFGSLGNVGNAGTGYSELFFYYVTPGAGLGFQTANQVIFQNALGFAKWSLAADGTATYSVPGSPVVPIPPAVWLLASGVVGLIGVARRKNAA